MSAAMGVAAAVLAWLAITGARAEGEAARQEAMARYGGELASVCVATREIEPGEQIDEGNTEVTEWVSSMLPEGALTSLTGAAGRTATSRIPAHAPLAEAHFERGESSIEVPRGRVAVSVASDPEHAVGGLLARGETVDVYVSQDAVASKLAQAVVLDTSSMADGGGEVTWVTLAVFPSSVKELLAATSRGMVTLVVPDAASRADEEER